MGGLGVEGLGRGREVKGGGAGDISSTLPYILHYHMVLRPKGTSHNKENTETRTSGGSPGLSFFPFLIPSHQTGNICQEWEEQFFVIFRSASEESREYFERPERNNGHNYF